MYTLRILRKISKGTSFKNYSILLVKKNFKSFILFMKSSVGPYTQLIYFHSIANHTALKPLACVHGTIHYKLKC